MQYNIYFKYLLLNSVQKYFISISRVFYDYRQRSATMKYKMN